jgi:hypothetical protein
MATHRQAKECIEAVIFMVIQLGLTSLRKDTVRLLDTKKALHNFQPLKYKAYLPKK